MLKPNQVWTAQVKVAYNGPFGDQGEVISRHKSYNAAEKHAKRIAPGESRNWLTVELILD